MFFNIPTSKDIYIEVDGKRVAVVESYKAKSVRSSNEIREIGNSVPVAVVGAVTSHSLELKRVFFTAESIVELDFHSLSSFNVVIVKPNKRILYTGCEWTSISEGVTIDEPCVELIMVTAAKRVTI